MKFRYYILFFIFLVSSNYLFGSTSYSICKNNKFILDGREERFTFFSRENVSSDKKIGRHGILVKRPNAKATVLICHGFMCNKYDISFFHLIFKDCNTMTFDFRAHGDDVEDQYCTFGRNEAYDVIGATKFIKNHPDLKNLPLIIYAFSMGAASSIIAGEVDRNLCDAMILDCPFDSSDKLIERGLSKIKLNLFGYEMSLPGSSLLKNHAYSPYIQSLLKNVLKTFANMDANQVNTNICPVFPEEAIKYISVPVFIIGCPQDDKVPEEAVKIIYDGALGFKRLWMCNARRHFDPIFFKIHEYIHRVNKFINDFLDGSLKNKKSNKIILDSEVKIV